MPVMVVWWQFAESVYLWGDMVQEDVELLEGMVGRGEESGVRMIERGVRRRFELLRREEFSERYEADPSGTTTGCWKAISRRVIRRVLVEEYGVTGVRRQSAVVTGATGAAPV